MDLEDRLGVFIIEAGMRFKVVRGYPAGEILLKLSNPILSERQQLEFNAIRILGYSDPLEIIVKQYQSKTALEPMPADVEQQLSVFDGLDVLGIEIHSDHEHIFTRRFPAIL